MVFLLTLYTAERMKMVVSNIKQGIKMVSQTLRFIHSARQNNLQNYINEVSHLAGVTEHLIFVKHTVMTAMTALTL